MMFARTLIAFSTAVAAALLPTAAFAQGAVTLSGEVKVVKMEMSTSGNQEVLVEPTSVLPGDRLVFTTRFTNNTSATVDNFVISNPLPKAIILTETGNFDMSIDGGNTFAGLDMLMITEPDGTERPAELSDVTDIRWTIASIAPGGSGQVKYWAAVR